MKPSTKCTKQFSGSHPHVILYANEHSYFCNIFTSAARVKTHIVTCNNVYVD